MPLTRRGALLAGGLAAAGAALPGGMAQARDSRRLDWLMDMVHSNPGEPPTRSAYNDPRTLAAHGHNAQVVNEFRPPHTAITFDGFDERIFPPGSDARAWVEWNAATIDERIRQIHDAGLRALYFTDIIVLPKRLVELHAGEILDGDGRIDLDRPLTRQIHRIMLAEVFDRFPGLDGLVVRTGETYLSNTPHHTGNNPITRGAESHLLLLDILREEVCARRGKLLFYRTWSFDGFHTDPAYYLSVTDRVAPHPNLIFTVKHTQGDYWRTRAFNPTLAIGRHPQVVEVQCQREYEGKGAHPNYIGDGVLNGFEENAGATGPNGLVDIRDNPNLRGIWTWSRGGGWRGPYIEHELWCDLNFAVVSRWARDTGRAERSIFDEHARRLGLSAVDRDRFRWLALASAAGVLRGHYSTVFELGRTTWMRDQFLGGSDKDLTADFQHVLDAGLVDAALAEKATAAAIWSRIDRLAAQIRPPDPETREYLRVSSRYGLLLHRVIHHGWGAMLRGFAGDRTGDYDTAAIRAHIAGYDRAWSEFRRLADTSPSCASLYVPQSFGPRNPDGTYDADPDHGMRQSVDRYR
ncbi:hypothetical protein SAMN05216215_102649 [Saccharopolyspora shandongensis]|uniref:Uncharacterized protein n=1 Tax=Saccharopolyspora shandongensis TaxID=418495 RepID=A0A1H3JNV6_9PSEU|nr:hypothetical protein [Saccharopolyspora shandongensis]SDY41279.1 hypothetical protein SAMN05216215_102649 [Saccharopolyspora shandongensis]